MHLYSSAAAVSVRRDGKLWVNGVPAPIPSQLSPNLSIRRSQSWISVTLNPHLEVTLNPKGEMTVTVTMEPNGELCGVCGDYDGDPNNDLRGPDGKPVLDYGAMAKAWRAPDFTP